jgi:hypothetical protein
MTKSELDITPSTTVSDLLIAYPEIEEKLISIAPPFKKLTNPLLRKSIAKVATIRNIASVGNLQLDDLIRLLREEVGQTPVDVSYKDEEYFLSKPEWFSKEKIAVSIVEDEVEDKDKMTVVTVLREAKKLNKGAIIELVTTFLPAPGIDSMKSKGYSIWSIKDGDGIVRTYFLKNEDE